MIDSRSAQQDRLAGALIPVFAIRTDSDHGIGDTAGVRELIDWASETGLRFLQFLPINEPCGDNSPYNAVSSIALDPLTLDTSPAAIPELSEEDYRESISEFDLEALRSGPVRYREVRKLKSDLLWRSFSRFNELHFGQRTSRELAFLRFCADEHEWLYPYCIFRMLMDMEDTRENWELWSEDYNTYDKAKLFVDSLLEADKERTERQLAYYAYIQFLAFRQWDSVASYARSKGVQLMGDIPFGVSRCSADVFAQPELFDLEWCGGAPPETNFKDDEFVIRFGQNWGIPLYRWDRMSENDYAWWKRRVSKLCRFFGIFRIDHALGFYRIYSFPWRPERNEEFLPLSAEEVLEKTGGRHPGFSPGPDDSEEFRARNRALGEQYLRALKQGAGSSEIVAEDLGTVPPYVPESLLSIGLAGMRVPMWETEPDGEFKAGSSYPPLTLATYATHDHDPMRAQWSQNRTAALHAESAEEREQSLLFLQRLARFAGIQGFDQNDIPEYSAEIREMLLGALFATSSRYASVMITDILGLEERFNIPGVLSDENWSYRLPMTMAELRSEKDWKEISGTVRELLSVTERLPQDPRSSPARQPQVAGEPAQV